MEFHYQHTIMLNNFDNFMNDLRITKKFDKVGITAGYFKSTQNVSMSWMWNSYLQEVSDKNPRLINVTDAGGNLLSTNGLYAYGVPFWGNCCTRNYDTQYSVSAPYANVSFDATKALSLEGGIRRIDSRHTIFGSRYHIVIIDIINSL